MVIALWCRPQVRPSDARMVAPGWSQTPTKPLPTGATRHTRQQGHAGTGTAELYMTQHETLRGANNSINFFVFRVDKEIPTEDIKTYLSEEGIQNATVECVSHEDARSKSFKINVKLQDKDKIMSSDFWPDGVACRLFYEKRVNGNAPSRRSSVSENIEQS